MVYVYEFGRIKAMDELYKKIPRITNYVAVFVVFLSIQTRER